VAIGLGAVCIKNPTGHW